MSKVTELDHVCLRLVGGIPVVEVAAIMTVEERQFVEAWWAEVWRRGAPAINFAQFGQEQPFS
jgi:hypothetical protein